MRPANLFISPSDQMALDLFFGMITFGCNVKEVDEVLALLNSEASPAKKKTDDGPKKRTDDQVKNKTDDEVKNKTSDEVKNKTDDQVKNKTSEKVEVLAINVVFWCFVDLNSRFSAGLNTAKISV
jgi:hypothetical protein